VIEQSGATVLIDPVSLNYMAGSEIDFVDDLIGAARSVTVRVICSLRFWVLKPLRGTIWGTIPAPWLNHLHSWKRPSSGSKQGQ
jgi:hypothetical protein